MKEILEFFAPHGLMGLVLGFLLFLIIVFITVIEKRDKSHTKNLKEIIESARLERESIAERSNSTTDKLSDAIIELTKSLK